MKKQLNKHQLVLTGLLLLLQLFPNSDARAQGNGFLTVQPSTENAMPNPTGATFTNDQTINNVFAQYGVISYRQRFPGAKTPRVANKYAIHATGNLDSLKASLETTEKFYEITLTAPGVPNCANPQPPVNDSIFANYVLPAWNLEMIGARCAWNITKGDSNSVIAVVDTE